MSLKCEIALLEIESWGREWSWTTLEIDCFSVITRNELIGKDLHIFVLQLNYQVAYAKIDCLLIYLILIYIVSYILHTVREREREREIIIIKYAAYYQVHELMEDNLYFFLMFDW